MNDQVISIRLSAFDHRLLDQAAREIANTVKRTGAEIKGPIPLPKNIKRYIVNRSPHIDKKSREQYEVIVRRRVIVIYPRPQTVEALMKLELAAGVDVEIKLIGAKQ